MTSEKLTLHTTTKGEGERRVAYCHGLFGQGKNWGTVAGSTSDLATSTLVDMPNHGRSPWTEEFDYAQAADALAETLVGIDDSGSWTVVGHSMGGKIAMMLALRHPELLDRLVVVDISPVDYEETEDIDRFVTAMQELDLGSIERRADADDALSEDIPDKGVRAFILQNLRRTDDGWRWQLNIDLLARSLEQLRGWPAGQAEGLTYEGPVTWVDGEDSGYVKDEMTETMRQYFPYARLVTVKDAGHWVHAEQPEVFERIIRRVLTADD